MQIRDVVVGRIYTVKFRQLAAQVRITGQLVSRQTGMLDGFRTVRGFPFEWVGAPPPDVSGEIIQARHLRHVEPAL